MALSPALEAPREAYIGPSALLALAMHVLFALALVLGVHWQSRAPDTVTVELWQAPPPEPAPRPEPPKAAPPRPAPPPPKPEPRIEKPDIAVKAAPKPKPKPKPPPPKPKPVAKPKPDDTMAKQLLAQALQREEQTQTAERERQAIKQQLQREAAAARSRAMQTWVDKIRAKIRGNIVMPPDIRGNPQAEVLVTQLPTGEVLDAKLVISSGYTAYDDAVVRAIYKSSPLPKPDTPGLFERDLKLTFRPQD